MKETSILANNHMNESGKKKSHKEVILAAMKLMPGAGGTFEEIAKAAGLGYSQVWKRLGELDKALLIQDSGVRRVLKSGCDGTVWVVRKEAPGADDSAPKETLSQQMESIAKVMAPHLQDIQDSWISFNDELNRVAPAPSERPAQLFSKIEYKKIDSGANHKITADLRRAILISNEEKKENKDQLELF